MPVKRLNTLKDVKVIHNSAILVERKDPDEVELELQDSTKKYEADVIDLDDTEDFRTVIVNIESEKDSH